VRDDDFEWSDDKAALNLEKHGVPFTTAREIFDDPFVASMSDPDHSEGEHRFLSVGNTRRGRTLIVAHTPRGARTRIIQARQATPAERRRFMNQKFDEMKDEMRPEYDFTGAVRGMFYTGRSRTTVMVSLDEDVQKCFSTSKEVNDALRMLIAEGRVPAPRDE
jgi:uncharacterized DUF497 family protein